MRTAAAVAMVLSVGCASHGGYVPVTELPVENLNAGTSGTSFDLWADGGCTMTVRVATRLARVELPKQVCRDMQIAKLAKSSEAAK